MVYCLLSSAAGSNIFAYADDGKIMQVIRNLLTNAVRLYLCNILYYKLTIPVAVCYLPQFKFTPKNGSVKLKLSISGKKRDSDFSNQYLLSNDSVPETIKQVIPEE